jgi:hypothetical protein
MPFSTADISIQLLMDTTNTLQEIESRMRGRTFGAVHNPEKGQEVRRVLVELLEILDRTTPDGVIGDTLHPPENVITWHFQQSLPRWRCLTRAERESPRGGKDRLASFTSVPTSPPQERGAVIGIRGGRLRHGLAPLKDGTRAQPEGEFADGMTGTPHGVRSAERLGWLASSMS